MIVKYLQFFQKQVLKLQKSYKATKKDIEASLDLFDPDKDLCLGNSIFKLRAKNSSIPCGKSGGYRVIAFFDEDKNILLPFLVYSKREKENVSEKEIEQALEEVFKEL